MKKTRMVITGSLMLAMFWGLWQDVGPPFHPNGRPSPSQISKAKLFSVPYPFDPLQSPQHYPATIHANYPHQSFSIFLKMKPLKTPVEKKETPQQDIPAAVVLPLGRLTSVIPGQDQKKIIYLTFDDGPGDYTQQIVDILDKNRINASFFWVGNNLDHWLKRDTTHIDFVHQMLKKGDIIGSHTMDHTALRHLPLQKQVQFIEDSCNFISEKIGHPITYFRPPYGSVDENTAKASIQTKEVLAFWEVDSEDWKYPHQPNKILDNIMQDLKPGAIILLHEKSQTTALLQHIIDMLREKGYDFAPLPTLRS